LADILGQQVSLSMLGLKLMDACAEKPSNAMWSQPRRRPRAPQYCQLVDFLTRDCRDDRRTTPSRRANVTSTLSEQPSEKTKIRGQLMPDTRSRSAKRCSGLFQSQSCSDDCLTIQAAPLVRATA